MDQKKIIIKFLKDKNIYEDVDEILINELIFNIEIMKKAKADMRNPYSNELDIQLNITRNDEKQDFFQKNRLLALYDNALKNTINIMKNLALNPADRAKMKLVLKEVGDVFDDMFTKR